MDLDALTVARKAEWERLDQLSSRRRLYGAEAEELVARYRAASADLADMKTSVGRSKYADHLSTILARARLRLTDAPESLFRQLPRFFLLQLPAALYRIRLLTAVIAALFLLTGILVSLWIAADPQLLASLGNQAELKKYAEEDFVNYYSDGPAIIFAGTVWTNNAWIAAQCVLFGVTGIWPVYVLIQNAVSVGVAAGILTSFGHGDIFLQYILPHGLLELTCIFAAAAAGLRVFWAMVAPGPRKRSTAVAEEGRALATVAIGLVFALALSGVIEGFVTPQPWPWQLKIVLGAVALAAFLAYMLVVGGRAYRSGETGDITEYEAGTPTLVTG